MIRDLRFARRSLIRTPVLTGAAVLSIALGISATTAVFSIVDAALFRPPPLEEPEQLVALYITRQLPNGTPERMRWSWPRFRLLQESAQSFEQVASFGPSVLAITSGEAEPVNAEIVSSSYFGALRVRPLVGRVFGSEDDEPATANTVGVISEDLWQRRFGGDRAVVGRTLGVNGVQVTILGVLPHGFTGLSGRAELWLPPTLPAHISYTEYQTTNQNFISAVGRLRRGVSIERARNELAVLGERIQRAIPSETEMGNRYSATAMLLSDARIDPSTRVPMLLLLAAAGCLLLLACTNVAGLLLGRAVSRRREIAIRVATGASRARVIRQLLIEAALLAATGGALGVLVAVPVTMRLGLPAAAWRGRNFYGALSEFASPRVDVRVIAFAIAVCALTAFVFGLLPALQATRIDLTSSLKEGAGDAGRGSAGRRVDLRRFIVAAETALAMVLLVVGGLLASSWRRLATSDTGFDRTHLLTFLIRPSEAVYPAPKAPALIARVLQEIERLPTVEAASVDGCAPVGTGCANTTLYIVGRPEPRADAAPPVLRHYIGPNHFRVLGVPVLRGRTFDARDRAGANRVAIINQLAAQRFWPNEDPIGKRVWFGGGSNFNMPDSSAEIIGIVGDVAYQHLDERPFQPDFYTPYAQFTYASRTVLVRTRGEPTAVVSDIRRVLRDVDPNVAMFDVRAMDDLIGDSWARLSYQTKVLASFALVALLLAATGIFAVIAHVISDRRREIGVRVALGATPVQVLAAVGAHGARPAAIGMAVGVILAIVTGRVLSSVVFGVRAADPLVLAPVTVLVLFVAGLSTSLAARRALSVDPAESLKAE